MKPSFPNHAGNLLLTLALAAGCAATPAPETAQPAQPATTSSPESNQAAIPDGATAAELLAEGRKAKGPASAQFFAEAARRAEAELESKPDDGATWTTLGRANFYLERDAPARKAFLRAAEISPDDANPQFFLGLLDQYAKRDDQAVERFRKATELDPTFTKAWFEFGRTLSRLGRFQEAIDAQKQVIALDPQDSEATLQIGVAENELGNEKAALAAFSKALELNPSYLAAAWNAAQTAQNLDEYVTSRALFSKVLTLNPSEWRAQAKLIQLDQALGDEAGRDAALERLLALRKAGEIPALNAATTFCRDQFSVGGKTVFAMEPFPGVASETLFAFKVAGADGKVEKAIVYGLNKDTNAIAAEQGDTRTLYHLESFEGDTQQLIGFFDKLDYDQVKALVVKALSKP